MIFQEMKNESDYRVGILSLVFELPTPISGSVELSCTASTESNEFKNLDANKKSKTVRSGREGRKVSLLTGR